VAFAAPSSTGPLHTRELDNLYREHHHWLLGWLQRRIGNAFDAADISQDTFVRLLLNGHSPIPEQSRSHLTQIAKGLMIDMHRRRLLETAWLDTLARIPEQYAPSAESRAIILESLVRIDTMLDEMPAKVRETFLLSRFEGLTYTEIATQLCISVPTVRKYMLKAAQSCMACLGGNA
jgi:RNA polymerase sigma-70 factor (ECF subfamily)